MTAEIARVTQAERRRCPETTIDIHRGEGARAGGAWNEAPSHPVSVTGPEGAEIMASQTNTRTNEEGTLDEFLVGSTARAHRAADPRLDANADIALVHMSDKCISP